jgi:hypothetical protein
LAQWCKFGNDIEMTCFNICIYHVGVF